MANSIEVKRNANFTGDGLAGWISWARLEAIMREAGELREHESINGFRADNTGIDFYIGYKGVVNNA